MNTLTLFLLEVFLCIGISTSVIYLLKPLLREILTETCGNQTRAEFWVMFTQLMLFIAPLLIVIFFASTEAVTNIHFVKVIQDTLFRSLLGEFIALAMIGQVIWKSINTTAEHTIPDALIATESKKQGG